MSNPGWPDPAALPFLMFGGKPGGDATTQPLAQGLAGGMDLIKKFWGNLPGGTALPGFLVPTVDVDELDKRVSDLRAAESWLEVNLNMLRATIQGLEVQRNTIAAIHSLSAMSGNASVAKRTEAPPRSGLPTGWPAAEASVSPAPTPAPTPAATAEPGLASSKDASSDAGETKPAAPVDTMTSNWLGFLQEQFAKVAQAALSPAAASDSRSAAPPSAPATAKRPARRTGGTKPRGATTSARRGARKPAGG